MSTFGKAKELYTDATLKAYQNFSDALGAIEIYGKKVLPVSLATLAGLGFISCGGKKEPVKPPEPTVKIPYNQALEVKQVRESRFYKPDGVLDFIKISLNVGDAVGDDGKNDAVVFRVKCEQQLQGVKQNMQSENEVYVLKGKAKFCPDPDREIAMDFPVTMIKGKNGEYMIKVSEHDKYLRFTGTGVSEVKGVNKPELKDGSISPKEIVNPVTRRTQFKHYHHRGNR